MFRSVPTFRGFAAVVAVLVGLTWGLPVAQAACSSAGHCGDSIPPEHCVGNESSPLAGCLMPLAVQEAVQTKDASVNPSTSGNLSGVGTRSIATPRASTSRRLQSRRAIVRADRRHAHVGVWLE